ncbi:MAG TPA: M81 family metallopeptidase, partial [Firmicutes bacterium]|nr:M81 family metallopeptidase [Bacillota bacterium]
MKTVLIAEFKQETNTFVPGKTTMEDFRSRNLLEGEEILTYFQGYKNEMGAFLEVLSSRRDIRIIPSIAANAQPGPMVHRDVYDYVRARLLQDIKKSGKLDGILLSFHGAMVVDGIEDPEGTLLEDIRRQVGGSLPLCLSLDFHANITRKMAQNATLMFPFRYYPHIDMYEAGLNAARAILGILDGTILPVMRVIKLPILCPLVPTDEEPFARFIEKAVSFEQVEDVLSAAIVAGFPYADIREGGMSVIVQTNNNAGRAEAMAQSLARTVWEAREELKPDSKPVAAAVTEALATPGVTVLADVVDNPGAGSPGDAAEII